MSSTAPWPEQGAAVQPASREEVAALIRQAGEDGVTLGGPGSTHPWDFSRLAAQPELQTDDMVVTVNTGFELGALKDMVEGENKCTT